MTPEDKELAKMHLRNWGELQRAVEAWIVKRNAELRSRAEAMNQQTGEGVSFYDDTTYYLSALLRVAEYEREQREEAVRLQTVEMISWIESMVYSRSYQEHAAVSSPLDAVVAALRERYDVTT